MSSLCVFIREILEHSVPWLVGLSAILFLAWFGLLIKEKRPFARELDWFARQPLPKKYAVICLLSFFAWWGGAKEGGNGGDEPSRSENLAEILRPASLSPPLRNLPAEVESSTNRLAITAFEVSQEEQTVAFETRWATNLFDYTDSGSLYLFMSTNLLEKHWTPLGVYEMPIDTNVCAFSISEQDVETSVRERFLDSFNGVGFYRFGIDFDSDGDGLADVIERLWHFTDPQNPDTDGDGLSDGEELSDDINTNPLVFDTDGDGIGDGAEIATGSNPNKSHSDYDDLSDAQEIGTMEALPNEEFLWFDISHGTDLIADYSSINGNTWTISLASHPTINNVVYTNALVGVDGFVHLLCPTNPGGWKSTGYNYSGGLSNTQWSAVHTTVALCNANLYAKPPSTEWGSKILYGSVESEGRTFGVIEYRNIGLYATRASNELIACQLILPSDETNTVYVSYLCASNAFREVNLTVGVQCGGIPSLKPGEKYYNLSWPLTDDFPSGGTTIKYTIGTWTDPAKTDTDGDGLSDSDEALVYGTDPLARDSDGDGASDGVELSFGTNPRNADTDGDGMPDGWEIRHELDSLLIDAELDSDADGLCNLDEYVAETNPHVFDTDGDGLSDGEETGRWEYVSGLPAFNTSEGTNLLPSASSSDSGQFVVALPFVFRCAGYIHTNVTVCLDGVVALMSNRESSSFSVGYGNGKIENCAFSSYHTTIAAYWDDLYVKTNEGSQIRVADVTVGGKRYAVIEYDKIRLYSQQNDASATGTFQVILPELEADTVYVRYVDMSSAFNGSSASIGAQLPKKELSFDVAFNQAGSVTNDMTIAYRFGPGSNPLIADTDGDGLNDGDEFEQETSARFSDTDGDGLVDRWEIQNGLDPLSAFGSDGVNGDPDGDHLSNEQECAYGTHPNLADSEGDGLSDGNETGSIFENNALPWLSFTTVEDLTGEITNVYGRCVSRPMPQALTIQGETVTNLTISANGLLFLNKSGYANGGNSISSSRFDYTVDKNALVIAPYLIYAYYRSDVPGKESSVKLGTAVHQNETYLLVEYANIHETSSRYYTNSISFQVAIPLASPDRAYVRYKDLTGNYMDGEESSIGMQTFDGVWMHSHCYYEKGKVREDLSLEFLFGSNTDPLVADMDGDGLSDGVEVNVTGSNPKNADADGDGLTDAEEVAAGTAFDNSDTDGDGLLDGWEAANNLNPLSATGSDGAEADNDQDGLTNLQEQATGSNPFAADTDGDGLGDAQELQLGTNVANADTDGDGLTDKQEVDANYDPSDPDMDRDGLIDGWEAIHGLNPQSSAGDDGADGDPDGDGLSNIDEYEEGTDPRNSDTDGDDVSDGEEVARGSDPTNPSDGGQAPAGDRFRTIQFNINGDYATWEMTIEGQGPDDTRTRKVTMARPNAAATTDLRLRKGNSYRLSMRWLNCDGHNDDSAPWYCWQAQLDGLPSRRSFNNYSNVRLEGNELILGDGWFAENAAGLLTSHVDECTTKSDGSFGGGNVAGSLKATLRVLDDPKLIPDYNRDGAINDADKDSAAQGKRLRFWINDDADSRATDGKYADSPNVDIPGAGSGRKPDWQDDEVNGWCDLLDFTPLGMDISALQVLPEEVREKLTFKIRHDEGSVNVVWTGLSKSSVGTFQNAAVDSCGQELDENSFEATTEQVSSNGIKVPEKLTEELRKASSDQGVFFLEGRSATQAPLKFDVYYENKKLVTGELPLTLSSVEEMYWFYSVRGAERTQSFPLPASYTPGNLSDDLIAKTVFFTHGFNVDKDEARAWGSEVFKRLWQSGSNAKFKMVTWAGDYNWTGSWANGVHYHQDVYQALKSASAYKRLVEREEPASAQRVLMAQSLGNMMTCEALRQGLTVGHYFMFNAAVASEALDASRQSNNADTNAKYIPSDWSAYPPLSFAANWHKWFKNDASDARGKMGWPDYFRTVLNNAGVVRNYYSTGDPVFMEKIPIPSLTSGLFHWPTLSWTWPFINLNLTAEVYSWQKQETRKGIDAIAGTLYGGWGFYCWTEMVGDVQSTEYYSVSEANALVSSGSITNTPVFSYSGTQMRNPKATQDDIWYALAKHVPAISSPVGGTTVDADPMGNFDLNTSKYRNGWGRNHRFYEDKWLHSDMKDMAFFYVYKLYNELIQKGGLK